MGKVSFWSEGRRAIEREAAAGKGVERLTDNRIPISLKRSKLGRRKRRYGEFSRQEMEKLEEPFFRLFETQGLGLCG